MNDKLGVRSLLWDKESGRLIKAINERDLCDFIDRFRAPAGAPFVVVDFAPAVAAFHKELEQQFDWRDLKELVTAKNSVFNSWVRFKSMTVEAARVQTGVMLGIESEKVLSNIHLALPERYQKYCITNAQGSNFRCPKAKAFDDLMCYVSAFIETLLCAVHMTTVIDAPSLKHDTILTGHAAALLALLIKYTKSECSYWRERFSPNSLIYQCSMEEMGVDVNPLLAMIDVQITKEQLCHDIQSQAKPTSQIRGASQVRTLSYEWPEADPAALKRVKSLALALQRITALSELIQQLKDGKFDASGKDGTTFDEQVDSLLAGGATQAHQPNLA